MGFWGEASTRMGFGPVTMGVSQAHSVERGYKSPWSPDDVLSQVLLEDLYGLATSVSVNRDKAMGLSVVSKARRVICTNIGRLTLETSKDGVPVPQQPSLLLQPERDRPLSETLTWTTDALYFYPQTWWIVQERDYFGWPTWVKLLDQADASVADGILTHAWGQPVGNRDGDIKPADVIQFNSVDGGLLHDARATLQRALILVAAASLAEDNPVPGLDIHNDGEELQQEEIEELLASWQAARRQRGVGYSSKAIKVTTLGNPVENLLIEGRKQIDLELVRLAGIPAWAADVPVEGASLNYQNRASRNWELIDLAMAPYMNVITSRLSMPDVTPRGWKTGLVLDEMVRDDVGTRYANYKTGLEAGFLTLEQIYEWEHWGQPAAPAVKPVEAVA